MTILEDSNMDVTINFIGGGNVLLHNAFILGNGIAGDTADGVARWYNDNIIESVVQH